MPINLGQPFTGAGTNHSSGYVPDPGPYSDSEAYLRTDGTWANPGVDDLRQRFNNLITYLLAVGFELPEDVVDYAEI